MGILGIRNTGSGIICSAHLAATLLLVTGAAPTEAPAGRGEGGAAVRVGKFCAHQAESLNIILQD